MPADTALPFTSLPSSFAKVILHFKVVSRIVGGLAKPAGGAILRLQSVSCWQLPRLVSRYCTLLARLTESQWSKRRAVRLMIRSTAQQRHCCCLRKQVPQQSGQHADLVNCAQRA